MKYRHDLCWHSLNFSERHAKNFSGWGKKLDEFIGKNYPYEKRVKNIPLNFIAVENLIQLWILSFVLQNFLLQSLDGNVLPNDSHGGEWNQARLCVRWKASRYEERGARQAIWEEVFYSIFTLLKSCFFFHFYVSYFSKLKDEGFAYHSKIIFKKSRLAKIHHWSFLAVHKLNNNFRAEAEKALAEAKEKGEAADVDKFERRLVKASGLVEGGENMERVAGDEGTEWRGQEAAHSDGRACCRGALRGWGAVRCSCQKWEGSNNFSLI